MHIRIGAGLGIVAELYRCDPGGGCYTDSPFYLQQLPPKKNRFYLQQLPKKGHFLKEMHQFFFQKKVQKFFAPAARYTAATPGGGVL